MGKNLISVILLGCCFLFFKAKAQDNNIDACGTVTTEHELNEIEQFVSDPSNLQKYGRASRALVHIPLQVHIVRKDDGTGGIELDVVLDNICLVNKHFEPTGFYFYLYGINYIDNSNYWNFSYTQAGNMRSQNNVSDVVDAYWVGDASWCGLSTGDAVHVLNTCGRQSGTTTLTHELGHHFGLPHTFYRWEGGEPSDDEKERVIRDLSNGGNCNTAGDRFCDTPADYLNYRWSCAGDGSYGGILTDPSGDTLKIDGRNYMSYASDACQRLFTDQQQARMRSRQENSIPLLSKTVNIDPLSKTSLVAPYDDEWGVPINKAELVWESVENAEQYLVQVSKIKFFNVLLVNELVSDSSYIVPDGILDEDETYYWRVKPISAGYTCAGFSDRRQFLAGPPVQDPAPDPSGIEDYSLTGIFVYPNPLNLQQNNQLVISSEQDFSGVIDIYDTKGRVVYQQEQGYRAGNNTLKVELNAGIYFLKIRSEGKLFTQKLAVIN